MQAVKAMLSFIKKAVPLGFFQELMDEASSIRLKCKSELSSWWHMYDDRTLILKYKHLDKRQSGLAVFETRLDLQIHYISEENLLSHGEFGSLRTETFLLQCSLTTSLDVNQIEQNKSMVNNILYIYNSLLGLQESYSENKSKNCI